MEAKMRTALREKMNKMTGIRSSGKILVGSRGMRKRKLYHLLVLMNPSERERLSVFLRSPFFNTNSTVIAFWELWLNRILLLPEGSDLSPEEFVEGSSIGVGRVDALCRDLLGLVRKFFTVSTLENAPKIRSLLFARSLTDRDPGLSISQKFLPQLERELQREPDSAEKQLALLYFEEMKSRTRILTRKSDLDWPVEFKRLLGALEEFARTKELEWSCGMANAVHIFRGEAAWLEKEFESANLSLEYNEEEVLLPRLYRLSLKMMVGKKAIETFPRIISILEHHGKQLDPIVRNDIFSFLLNFCIRKINQGEEDYLIHAFELYRLLIQSGDLLIEGQISPQQYKNVVSLACRVGKLEWAEAFMNGHKQFLADDQGGMAVQYNHAVILFHRSEFAPAIREFRKLIQIPSSDVFYGLDARIYLWKSYFEHRLELSPHELDDMFRLYDSFRLYVDRNKHISQQHQKQYRNLVRLFKKFLQLLEQPDQEKRIRKLQGLRKTLDSEEVANITWFSKKVDEALQRELS